MADILKCLFVKQLKKHQRLEKKFDSTLVSIVRRFPRRTTPNTSGGGDMYFLQEHINTPSGNKQKLLPLRVGGTYIYKCVSGS